MGIAVVRRNPGFLEQLAMTVLPGLMGSMIEQGQERSRNASVLDAFAAMYPNTQPKDAPTPDVKFDSQYAGVNPDSVAQEEPMIYKALGNLFAQQGNPSAQPGWNNVQQEVTRQNASDKMGALLQDPAFRKGVTNAGPGLLEKALAMYQGQDQAHSQGLRDEYSRGLIDSMDVMDRQNRTQTIMNLIQTNPEIGKTWVDALEKGAPDLAYGNINLENRNQTQVFDPVSGNVKVALESLYGLNPTDIEEARSREIVAGIDANSRLGVANINANASRDVARLKAAGSPQNSSPANLPTTVVPFVKKVVEGLGTPLPTPERVAQSFGETPLGRELSESNPAEYDTQVASMFQTQIEDRKQRLVAQRAFLSDYSQHPDVGILLGQIDKQISTLDEMLKNSAKPNADANMGGSSWLKQAITQAVSEKQEEEQKKKW